MIELFDVVTFLADDAPRNTGPDFGKASPFGLLVIVLLLLGTFLLVRSMNRQLKKVPESFDPQHPEPDQAADEGTVGVDAPADRDGSPREPDE
ncbi:hypothetical protein A5707_19000 [Mycobacterium kyorinense]|uniref:Uncharacterized protein n=1 Tax=Mycobacterium kyorinense TaxID=487514 RepID=A0A1A2ZD15_9MYCO|nr:hypothetical protein [Mycobacterium kyorinense]OBI47563.1 hypothetical protein A5707_19000 [Mycobacterium kyorinense]